MASLAARGAGARALPPPHAEGGDHCPLPQRWLQISRRLAAGGLTLLFGGVAAVFLGGVHGPVAGSVVAGLGLGLLLSAGYYWGCGNKGCV